MFKAFREKNGFSLLPLIMGVAYGASPFDLIPDLIPLIGWVDDGILLAFIALITAWQWLGRGRRARTAQLQPIRAR